ncbi:MAG: 6-hydroxymethylpterin diphosphokinase MptE-like protein [Promethearchaeota archaeon]
MSIANKLWDSMNYYEEFLAWYIKIFRDFQFDSSKEMKGRDYLSRIMKLKENKWRTRRILHSFHDMLAKQQNIIIYGCGPTLEMTIKGLEAIDGMPLLKNTANLAADGAAIFLEEKNIPITAIFTDLDGITPKEFEFAQYIIVHAHGDNIDKLEQFKEAIINFHNIIGTTQIEPTENLVNPGGFTDGDRILFFLRPLLQSYHELFLIGMDFDDIIGRYSKPFFQTNQEAHPIKKKKLKYGLKLVEWVLKKMDNEIYFVNSAVRIRDFKKISLVQFKHKLINAS